MAGCSVPDWPPDRSVATLGGDEVDIWHLFAGGRVGRASASTQGTHHVFDPGVLLEPVHRQILTVTGMAEPTVRHLRDERQVRVDPDGPEVQPRGHPHRAAVIAGP